MFTIGSCFARNIEEYLLRLGLIVPTMSFSAPRSELPSAERETGLLNKYTPDSIAVELDMALSASPTITPRDCLIQTRDDAYIDLQLPSENRGDPGAGAEAPRGDHDAVSIGARMRRRDRHAGP